MTVTGEARPSVGINRPMILATITLSTMVVVLDMSITVIALPHMQGGLSATADQVAWVMTSYIVTMSIMIAYTGWLGSRIGRRRLYIASTVLFTVGALLSGSADSLTELVIYRSIQGAAAAPAFPLGQAIILDSFPRERHGQALAYWGVGIMVAPVTGPILGGYITEIFDWRWVFFLAAPLGVLSVLLASKYLVDVGEDRQRKFDWLGFAALAAVLGAAQLMMDRGQRVGWFESTEIVIEAAIVGLGLYVLIVHMLTTRNPYLPPALFTDRNYMLGLAFSFVLGTFVLSGNYVLTLFLQNIQGYPVMSAGMILTPRAIGTLVALVAVGRLIMHLDARILIATGFAATAISSLMLAQINADVGVVQFSIAAFLNGFGTGCIWAPMMTLMFSTLHRQYRTEGSMLVNLIRSYGSGLGISIAAVVLTRSQSVAYSELTEYITPYREVLQLPDAAGQWSLETATGLAALQAEVSQQAFMFGILNNFLWAFVAAGIALPLVALFRRSAETPEYPDRERAAQ